MKKIFPAVVLALFWTGVAGATQVSFQWNASTGAVAGYKLYQGTASGTYAPTLTTTIPGTGTTGTMDMDPTASRYVAATAYDAGGRESAFSNEILCHPIIVNANAGGTVSPSGTFFVQDSRAVTFTVTPAQFFRVKQVTVNGVPTTNYTLTSVKARSVIAVEFEAIPIPSPPGMLQIMQSISASLERIAKVMDPDYIPSPIMVE